MDLAKQISNTLAGILLISSEKKEYLNEKLHLLEEEDKKQLWGIISKAKANQDRLLKTLLEVHPDFFAFIENKAAQDIENKLRHEEEESDLLDQSKLQAIEQKIQ